MPDIPFTDSMTPRPVWKRFMVMLRETPPPPTEEEKQDAIRVLEEFGAFADRWQRDPWFANPAEFDTLILTREAFRILDEYGR